MSYDEMVGYDEGFSDYDGYDGDFDNHDYDFDDDFDEDEIGEMMPPDYFGGEDSFLDSFMEGRLSGEW